jgi:hypothetical protein
MDVILIVSVSWQLDRAVKLFHGRKATMNDFLSFCATF